MSRAPRRWSSRVGVAWGLASAIGLGTVGLVSALGQQPPKQPEPRVPGWYVQVSVGGKETAKLHAANAAFVLGEREVLASGTPAAEQTTHTARVAIEAAGRYRFGVESSGGTARLTVYGAGSAKAGEVSSASGTKWTGWIDLPVGSATVAVAMARAGTGPAGLRTFWEKEGVGKAGFRPEPIPMAVASVPPFGMKGVEEAERALRGRVLLSEMGCVNCHSADSVGSASAAVLRRMGPDLSAIGKRTSPEFLRRWVSDPQGMKPGCGMPDVIGETPKDAADAEAIVHFLASVGGPWEPEPVGTETQGADLGRRLYHTVGCVACHGALEPAASVFGEGSPGAMPQGKAAHPFGAIAGKWNASGLAAFLQDPLKSRPAGRMPSMSLSAEEADLIAVYLVKTWGEGKAGSGFDFDEGKAAAGRAAFAERGCVACHEFGATQPGWKGSGKPMTRLTAGKGCLDTNDKATPRYTLTTSERADLGAGLSALGRTARAPLDEARVLVSALGCRNCHEHEGFGGPADELKAYFRTTDETELGDEGRFPPRLTGVGGKLRADWLRKVLVEGGRARPYMATRMPQFGEGVVGGLHAMLAATEGMTTAEETEASKPTDELVQAGRRLVGEKGMNCISCHTFGGKSAGTAGPEMTVMAERIRPSWWQPYIMDPQRFKPGTRMTAFFETGRGSVADVFGGDANRQSEALWAYLCAAKAAAPPEGLPSGAGLPVAIEDRPTVFRSFLKDAGSRAIAVGYPSGVHFAFDAEGVRLVSAWKGEFIDATGAWKGRGGTITGGRGPTIWTAPSGPALVIGSKPATWPKATGAPAGYRFRGYSLDEAGVPSFRYEIGEGVTVEERFEPMELGAVIRRTFMVRGVPAGATVWVNAGEKAAGSTAIENVAEVIEAGDDKMRLVGVRAKDSAAAVTFSIEIRP